MQENFPLGAETAAGIASALTLCTNLQKNQLCTLPNHDKTDLNVAVLYRGAVNIANALSTLPKVQSVRYTMRTTKENPPKPANFTARHVATMTEILRSSPTFGYRPEDNRVSCPKNSVFWGY